MVQVQRKTNSSKKASVPQINLQLNLNLNILTWNIQSSKSGLENKFDDPAFTDILLNHNIICLQEIRQSVHLPGYRAKCNLRPGENNGGVGILYKNEYIGGIGFVQKYKIQDVLICKLKKSFFKLNQDIYIINAYLSPSNSTISKTIVDSKELLHQIENIVNDLRDKGDIIICGDFNARISDHPGLIEHENDNNEHIPLPDDYTPDIFTNRCTMDTQTNNHKKDFLSLILNNRLTILNGRTLGDFKGEITCIRPNGVSVVDYFAVSHDLHSTVQTMKVLTFTHFSDHKPLSLTLSTNPFETYRTSPIEDCYTPAPSRFIFNAEAKELLSDIQLQEQFNNQLDDLEKTLKNFGNTNNDTDADGNITRLTDSYCKYLHDMTSLCCDKTKNNPKKKKKDKPWYNWQCRAAKSELQKAARTTSKFPMSDFLRKNFYKVKKSYKTLRKKHENIYFDNLNRDIENGKILNWHQFKRLKSHKSDKIKFDSHDMNNFESFFTNLYSDEHPTINQAAKQSYINMADNLSNLTSSNSETLNCTITSDEVKSSILVLKSGKASSFDMISNEILKSLNNRNIIFLTNLFNLCMESGSYPWNASVITPLLKKGSSDNPDNYRAIAVSSVLGKLFSTILLNRLTEFRHNDFPDPPNQLGFTKKAQTYDHILTMQTIASKYKKMHKKVYAVFVDFKKAFDSVCRQALFYKLAFNGITGKFYNVLRSMYSKSYAHIKLSGYLSNKIEIKKGTEQGHPLSPELFKIFLSDLSPLLDCINCPKLMNMSISHLLWADDLIMLALDPKTSQFQLDRLQKFCNDWGIEINDAKTKVVIFGRNNKSSPSETPDFYINNKALEVVSSYCYLGIILHESGKFSFAIKNLKTKAMRAFFGLKRTINRSKVSFRALTTLFDSLIKPIILYGAPIWTPTLSIVKNLSSAILTQPQNFRNIIPKINRLDSENIHMSFLKWALGVHRKASNVGIWGESGRYPLIYQSIKLSLNYYERLTQLSPDKFAYAALQEQKLLNLPWYKNIELLMKTDPIFSQDHVTASYSLSKNSHTNKQDSSEYTLSPNINNARFAFRKYYPYIEHLKQTKPLPSKLFRPNYVLNGLKEHFKFCWEYEKSNSPKLSFYHSLKSIFQKEPYLDIIKKSNFRYRTTRLRISAHDLSIEMGRYSNMPRDTRICKWCKLTLANNITEDENHMLYHCDLYANLRNKLIENLKSALSNGSNDPDDSDLNNNLSNLVSPTSLDQILMLFTSPNTNYQCTGLGQEQLQQFHKSRPNGSKSTTCIHIINRICRYIANCFETRWSFLNSLKPKTHNNIM